MKNFDYIFDQVVNSYADQNMFCVIIGAMDGVKHDHFTPYLRANKHWEALMVEPVPTYFEQLKENYKDREFLFENSAIGAEAGRAKITMIPEELVGTSLPQWCDGISTLVPDQSIIRNFKNVYVEQEINVITFNGLVNKHDILEINAIQIDAEGYDAKIFYDVWNAGFSPEIVNIEVVHMTDDDLSLIKNALMDSGYNILLHHDDMLAYR